MSGDHNMNQTSPGWRKRQIALDIKAENARKLGLDYEPSTVECMCGICKLTQRKPLTDEEVIKLKMEGRDLEFVNMTALHRFARAIEAAHNIKD